MRRFLSNALYFILVCVIPEVFGQGDKIECPPDTINCITAHKVHCHFLKSNPTVDLNLSFKHKFRGIIKATLKEKQQCKLFDGTKKAAKLIFLKINDKTCPGFERLKEGDNIKTNITVQFDPDLVQIVDKLYQVECSPSKLYYEAIVGTTVNNAFTGRSSEDSADADMIEVNPGSEYPSVFGQPMSIVMGEKSPSQILDASVISCRLMKGTSEAVMNSSSTARNNEMGSFRGEEENCSTFNKLGFFMKETLRMNINDPKNHVRKKIMWMEPTKRDHADPVTASAGEPMTLVCDMVACKTFDGGKWSPDQQVCEEQKCRVF